MGGNLMQKQTAVAFLIEVMQKRLPPFYAHFMMDMDSVYEQALAMEERQIIDAHDSGYIDGQGQKSISAEQYYTETYGE
jgi:hypothetical protein